LPAEASIPSLPIRLLACSARPVRQTLQRIVRLGSGIELRYIVGRINRHKRIPVRERSANKARASERFG
jgi:hypothetical protein